MGVKSISDSLADVVVLMRDIVSDTSQQYRAYYHDVRDDWTFVLQGAEIGGIGVCIFIVDRGGSLIYNAAGLPDDGPDPKRYAVHISTVLGFREEILVRIN